MHPYAVARLWLKEQEGRDKKVVSLAHYRMTRKLDPPREVRKSISQLCAEAEQAIRAAEVEAFVNSLNPVSERTRQELIKALL